MPKKNKEMTDLFIIKLKAGIKTKRYKDRDSLTVEMRPSSSCSIP